MKNTMETLVGIGEMKNASYPEILTSGNMGPNIAICIHDFETKRGHMMHHSRFEAQVDLDTTIKEVKKDYLTPERLEAYAAGSSMHDAFEELWEMQKSDRKYVENVLRRHFKKAQIRIEWMPNNYVSELRMDTTRGEVRLIKISPDDMVADMMAEE